MTTFTDAHRSDFDGNGFADVFWRDAAGDDVLWLMNNNVAGTMAAVPKVTPDWHFKAAADFDHAGVPDSDILWQNDSGALALWQMNGTTVSAVSVLPNPGPTWHVVGDNDFNGDTADDILFQNDNGSLAIWTFFGASSSDITGMFAGTQNPGPTWHVVGTGDTTGVGSGILWQHNSGALVLWEKPTFDFDAGAVTFSTVAALPTIDPSWHVKGFADVNGGGTADVVFQHDSGAVVVWEIGGASGTTVTAANLVNLNPGPSWHIAGLRDMNHDGHADILFQNDSGAAAVWENYQSLGGGMATFNAVLPITPNPNPNGHVWDLL